MKAGDLVKFRGCAEEGQWGIISLVPEQSVGAEDQPWAVYWVAFAGGNHYFTGAQLEVVNENR